MLEVLLTWVFWKTVLMILSVGSPIVALALYGMRDSRKRNKDFVQRLYAGEYENVAAERKHLTTVS